MYDPDQRQLEQGGERLGRLLRDAEARRLPDTTMVDAAIAAAARRDLRPVARPRRLVWRIAAPLAAAAAVAIAATVTFLQPSRVPAPRVAIAGDLDGSGLIDVLDAYVLARSLQTNAALPGTVSEGWGDINADGVVDRRDVDALAMQAVALEGGRG